ncbi:MAG: hypothetical protein IJI46_04055, partial [Erysipelotrichaceae bacterium]|nr:hypothetical protein [Erysipelotrichaceae bacterium]
NVLPDWCLAIRTTYINFSKNYLYFAMCSGSSKEAKDFLVFPQKLYKKNGRKNIGKRQDL